MGQHSFANPQDVLEAIQNRMIGTLRGANGDNVIITQNPTAQPPTVTAGRDYWTLTMGGGSFDSGAWDGAHSLRTFRGHWMWRGTA